MRWVTRKGVKFDRSACAWLILRHIDPQAEFAYLDAGEMDAAIAAGAQPFHNITFAGPGSPRAQSSFEDLLQAHGLDTRDPALALLAGFVHRGEIGGEATGADDPLRAIAKGMNALVHSDAEMVEWMLPVYDALYAYCQRQAVGTTRWAGLEPGWGQT